MRFLRRQRRHAVRSRGQGLPTSFPMSLPQGLPYVPPCGANAKGPSGLTDIWDLNGGIYSEPSARVFRDTNANLVGGDILDRRRAAPALPPPETGKAARRAEGPLFQGCGQLGLIRPAYKTWIVSSSRSSALAACRSCPQPQPDFISLTGPTGARLSLFLPERIVFSLRISICSSLLVLPTGRFPRKAFTGTQPLRMTRGAGVDPLQLR